MATEKTWQFDMNRAYVPSSLAEMAKYVLWYYKAFLTGQIGGAVSGLWTLVGSSDAVTGALDGVDRWTATYNAAKLVRAASGSPHSWVVLKSPLILGKYYYLLLDYSQSSNDYEMNITLGADGAPTGGTYQAAPTIPNSSGLGNTDFALSANNGPVKLHGQLATDGSFNVFMSRDNTGQFASVMLFQVLANYKGTDSFPCWFYQQGDSTLAHGVGYVGTSPWGLEYGTKGIARAPDNSQAIVTPGAILPVSTYVPSGPDSFDGSYIDWPLWIGTRDSTTRCVKGRLQDITYFGGGATTGAVDNPSGSPSFMIVNNFWFPTNAAPAL
jgi:hypothetical protein